MLRFDSEELTHDCMISSAEMPQTTTEIEMTASVINANSTKQDIIQGAEEYITATDAKLENLRGDRNGLLFLLAVTATIAALF